MATGAPHGVGAGAGSAARVPDPARRGWTAGRVVAPVAGSILVLACVALLGGAGMLTWADQQQDRGYLATGTAAYSPAAMPWPAIRCICRPVGMARAVRG